MEKVFWLMWLSDVVGGVGVVGWFAALALALVTAAILFVRGMCDEQSPLPELGRALTAGRWLAVVVLIAVLTPNSRTIQILAVSSAADAAASTALGQKSIEALNAVLDRVIGKN